MVKYINFHTIKSILNNIMGGEYDLTSPDFHTIKSILNIQSIKGGL